MILKPKCPACGGRLSYFPDVFPDRVWCHDLRCVARQTIPVRLFAAPEYLIPTCREELDMFLCPQCSDSPVGRLFYPSADGCGWSCGCKRMTFKIRDTPATRQLSGAFTVEVEKYLTVGESRAILEAIPDGVWVQLGRAFRTDTARDITDPLVLADWLEDRDWTAAAGYLRGLTWQPRADTPSRCPNTSGSGGPSASPAKTC